MKLFSEICRPLIYSGLKVRLRKWPEDYYIYRDGDKLMDSMGNVYHHSWEEFIRTQSETLNNFGRKWELYEEVEFNNL